MTVVLKVWTMVVSSAVGSGVSTVGKMALKLVALLVDMMGKRMVDLMEMTMVATLVDASEGSKVGWMAD